MGHGKNGKHRKCGPKKWKKVPMGNKYRKHLLHKIRERKVETLTKRRDHGGQAHKNIW